MFNPGFHSKCSLQCWGEGQGTQSNGIKLVYPFIMSIGHKDYGGHSEHVLYRGVIILKKRPDQQNPSFLGWPFTCLLEIKEETPENC